MNLKPILALSAFLFASTFIAKAEDATPTPAPPELIAAQEKHDAELVAATKKVNEAYLAELGKMKKKAMADGKLEMALAVDKEIKSVEIDNILTKRDIEKKLIGTKWEFKGHAVGEQFTFVDGGKARRDDKAFITWKVKSAKDRIVEGICSWNGDKYSLKFNEDFTSATYMESNGSIMDFVPVLPPVKTNDKPIFSK